MSDEEEFFEMSISFKDPDSCQEFLWWACKDMREKWEAEGLDEDEIADRCYEENPLRKFFEYGEYGSVEIRVDKYGRGTCTLTDWPSESPTLGQPCVECEPLQSECWDDGECSCICHGSEADDPTNKLP